MDSPELKALLAAFFSLTGKDDLYATALQIEGLNDKRAVRPLIRALLEDENPHRRHAAARALGWIGEPRARRGFGVGPLCGGSVAAAGRARGGCGVVGLCGRRKLWMQ